MSFSGGICGLRAFHRVGSHSGERRSCLSQKSAGSDSKGQLHCRGGEWASCLLCLGGGVLEVMTSCTRVSLGADGHASVLIMVTRIYVDDKM